VSARIDPKLIQALRTKLGIQRAAAYQRIAKVSNELAVTRRIGALAVAQTAGIGLNRFATADELAQLRDARAGQTFLAAGSGGPPRGSERSRIRSAAPRPKRPPANVFVVHGRNDHVRRSMFDFLRAIGLTPLEWGTAMKATRSAAPYIGDVLEKAFAKAGAVIVLITPDDEARLNEQYWGRNEEPYEKKLMGQARPNVLFEAGMAFGSHPRATVLVEIGKCRPFSDVFGRHVVRLNNSADKRQELADKLDTAGCPVQRAGKGWLEAGDFSDPAASAKPGKKQPRTARR
jgi:predicted nucleotide-binding protein